MHLLHFDSRSCILVGHSSTASWQGILQVAKSRIIQIVPGNASSRLPTKITTLSLWVQKRCGQIRTGIDEAIRNRANCITSCWWLDDSCCWQTTWKWTRIAESVGNSVGSAFQIAKTLSYYKAPCNTTWSYLASGTTINLWRTNGKNDWLTDVVVLIDKITFKGACARDCWWHDWWLDYCCWQTTRKWTGIVESVDNRVGSAFQIAKTLSYYIAPCDTT